MAEPLPESTLLPPPEALGTDPVGWARAAVLRLAEDYQRIVNAFRGLDPALAKVWADVNLTSVPASLRRSFNVAAIIDNNVGDYTLTFQQPFADADYAVSATSEASGPDNRIVTVTRGRNQSSCQIVVVNSATGEALDVPNSGVVMFGKQ